MSHKGLSDVDHPVDCSGSILGTKERSDGVLDVTDRSGGSKLTLEDPEPEMFWVRKVGRKPQGFKVAKKGNFSFGGSNEV